jgi:hypothetical protein
LSRQRGPSPVRAWDDSSGHVRSGSHMLGIRIGLPLSLVVALACAAAGTSTPSEPRVEPTSPTPLPAVPDEPPLPEVPAPKEPEPRTGLQNGVNGTLFGAIVDERTRRWQVVMVTYDPPDDPSLPPLGEEDEGERSIASLPAGHAWIPEGWAKGDVWTLVTPSGATRHRVSGIGAWTSAASGTLHTEVRLAKAKGKKGPAVAIRGDVIATAPKLHEPVDAGIAALGEGALARITEAVAAAHEEPTQQEEVRKAPVLAKSVTIIAGKFPGGRTHAIIVRHAVSDDLTANAVLYAGEAGKIELLHLGYWDGDIRPFAVGDLDADGLDDLVIEQDSMDDSHTLDLVHWSGGRPKLSMLTGTGL